MTEHPVPLGIIKARVGLLVLKCWRFSGRLRGTNMDGHKVLLLWLSVQVMYEQINLFYFLYHVLCHHKKHSHFDFSCCSTKITPQDLITKCDSLFSRRFLPEEQLLIHPASTELCDSMKRKRGWSDVKLISLRAWHFSLVCRYSFCVPPKLELHVCPKLGEREVTFCHVTEWIEKKLQNEFKVR